MDCYDNRTHEKLEEIKNVLIEIKNLLQNTQRGKLKCCLLYTSDAADDTPCVDLGGRRIIKKKIF